ncbi:MAG TPA: M14 metallopeptidase family protein [Thermoanaerobaculia bacterium]|nr:M14 metallopeptidase family protein [Thermoanaerobaculia bacterium]
MRVRSILPALLLATLVVSPPATAASAPSPSEFLKLQIGADRTLADWGQIVSYFRALDTASDRVEVTTIGKSTLGEEMILAAISSPENLANKARIREIARRLADPRGLSEAESTVLVQDGKAVLLVTCAIHASEIASTQMAMEWAHALATAEDAETKRRLSEVVLLLVPSLNPDGNRMEVDWYRKNLGTRWEGSRMPWLYHHYTGHDNNRDFTQLTQSETKAITRVLYHDWFPQIFLDEHQMGANGPRMFVPPYAEPLDPDIHPLVIREVNMIGSLMSMRLEQAGKSGVISAWTFDASWPGGSKNTAWWKNVTGVLTEVASARLATPVDVPPTELRGGGKGLVTYGTQVNFPNPWRGGRWGLRDIMDYERVASDAIHEYAATHRADVLSNMLARARASIAAAAPGEAFRIPASQRDPATARTLAALLVEHGVEVKKDAAGDAWVPLAQPYGRFVREMLEPQRFPEVKLVPGRDIVAPYDVTAWSLPLSMGVSVEKGVLPAGIGPWGPPGPVPAPPAGTTAFALGPQSPERWKVVAEARKGGVVAILTKPDGALPAGTIVLDAGAAQAAARVAADLGLPLAPLGAAPSSAVNLRAPRVGLYKPWAASMDEGWTRFLLERYGFAPVTLDNAAIRAGKLATKVDVLVLPDVEKEVIVTGKPKREEGEMRYFPEPRPEYAGGLGKEGTAAIREFVEGGGTLVALASASEYAIDELQLPVRNVLGKAKAEEFLCPGTLVRIEVDTSHPVTFGLPASLAAFLDGPLAFQTSMPGAEMTRTVLASYPAEGRDVLVSGWIRGEEKLTRNAAAVALTSGKGRVVLLGFRAQHRAQTNATFPFLFNSLAWSVM